jgi:hypothetical protein
LMPKRLDIIVNKHPRNAPVPISCFTIHLTHFGRETPPRQIRSRRGGMGSPAPETAAEGGQNRSGQHGELAYAIA